MKEWDDDDAVAYDLENGDTHVVDVLAMELLHLVRQGHALSTEALVAELRQLFENETDAQVAVRVERGLERLRVIGLVVARGR